MYHLASLPNTQRALHYMSHSHPDGTGLVQYLVTLTCRLGVEQFELHAYIVFPWKHFIHTGALIHSHSVHCIMFIHPLRANAFSKQFQSALTSQKIFFHHRDALVSAFSFITRWRDSTTNELTLKNKQLEIGLRFVFLHFVLSAQSYNISNKSMYYNYFNSSHWFQRSETNLNATKRSVRKVGERVKTLHWFNRAFACIL